jgi:hypothetical protein
MTRIFIEDQELDITKDFSQQITYAVDDLTNTDSKATSFSKTIVLPGTANNNRLLGNIFEFGNNNFTADTAPNVFYNFNASKAAKARMEINGLKVMKGVLRLLEIIRDGDYVEYEVALFGELGGFYASMGARKLTDLDFSEYNHFYNVTSITNSWDNANAGEGYYYPLIDYGNTSPGNLVDFNKKSFYFTAFRPAFFVKQYMDKILTQAGYTYTSNFFNTDFFKRLIIPNNQNRLAFYRVSIFDSNPSFAMGTSYANIPHININTDTFVDDSGGLNRIFKYNSLTPLNAVVNANLNGTFKVVSSSDELFDFNSSERYGRFRLYKNNNILLWQSNEIGSGVTGTALNNSRQIPYSIQFRSVPITMVQNDTFTLKFEITRRVDDNDPTKSATFQLAVNSNNSSMIFNTLNPVLTSAVYGDRLAVNGTLPANILQKDFFTSILKMFNLMVTEDRFTEKHLVIEPYVDFYDTDGSTYIDWSDKVDRSKPIKIKPMSEVNARFYQFKYKSDNDYYNEQYRKKYNEGYGDRVYDNALDFAKETDTTEVIFSATTLVGYSGNDKVFPAIYKRNNNAEEMVEHNIRILQAKKITGRESWYIYAANGNVLAGPLNSYPYAGHLNDWTSPSSDLNFGVPKEVYFTIGSGSLNNNLFNAYYSPYFAEITDKDSRLVTCKMRLNEKDIFNLDFGQFVWVDGVLYRLVKIVDYTEDDVCEVQLLRAINTTY